jgi:hypothetical protein
MAFAPYIPLRASRSNLGALGIIMNFSTLVYNIHLLLLIIILTKFFFFTRLASLILILFDGSQSVENIHQKFFFHIISEDFTLNIENGKYFFCVG